jgi:hypothetical protein
MDILDTIDDGKREDLAPKIEFSYSSSEVLSPTEEILVKQTSPVKASAASSNKKKRQIQKG